jgi:putative colanic acid biosysnthesis UDP-glucose lipid carrier transferase
METSLTQTQREGSESGSPLTKAYTILPPPLIENRLLGSPLRQRVKRAEDVIMGSLILLIIMIPMLLIAIAVKFSSPGPVLFRQRRRGLGGREIKILKFRTMTCLEDGACVTQAKRDDRRITRLGSFLRRTSLDELPQFIQVITGDMSIVGPRPHAHAHNEFYTQVIPGYDIRHSVRPGITGWAQINGWRGETDTIDKMVNRIEHDLDYLEKWSLWLDLVIIIRTAFGGFMSKNAY